MSAFTAMDIAASGLSVQRTRMSLVASNLANLQSTRDPEVDGPYRRREMVVQATPANEFSDLLRAQLQGSAGADVDAALRTVQVESIQMDSTEPLRVYDPGHPEADEMGFVLMPNISVMREMVDMMAAARAYEANLATLRTTRDMINGALEMGRS